MISYLRRRFFTVRYIYSNPIDRQRARALLVINWTIILAMAAWLLTAVIPLLINSDQFPLQSAIALTLTLTLSLVIYRQIQTGRLRSAVGLFVFILVFNILLFTATLQRTGSTSISSAFMIALAIPLVAAGVLLNRRGIVLVALALVGVVIYAVIGQSQNTVPFTYVPAESFLIDMPVVIISLGLILTFLLVFTANLERIATESLSDVQQRQWVTEFGIELGSLEDENRVLSRALDVIRDRFGYIFAQVFLLDEEKHINRLIRIGSAQVEPMTRDAANLSDANIVFEALRAKAPILTYSDDALPRRSHLISAATYGVAIPIQQGDSLLGVLDVQSARSVPFTQNELNVLELLGDQLGIALQHSQTVDDLERTLREQQAANARLQSQVSDYLQRERRGVGSAWSQYLDGRGKAAIGYNIEPDNTATLIPASDIPETLYSTLQEGKLHIETQGDEQVINVPIMFRDQTLGAMSFALPKDQPVSERQVEMARIVAERLALALENTRLFEQSQAQAFRERKASEVNSLLIGATDVPSVLNLAAENFNEALGAVHTRIYIQPGFLSEPLAETPQSEEAR